MGHDMHQGREGKGGTHKTGIWCFGTMASGFKECTVFFLIMCVDFLPLRYHVRKFFPSAAVSFSELLYCTIQSLDISDLLKRLISIALHFFLFSCRSDSGFFLTAHFSIDQPFPSSHSPSLLHPFSFPENGSKWWLQLEARAGRSL